MTVKKSGTRKTRKTGSRRTLSPAQLRQRRYASAMRGVRARAKTTSRGTGRIANRSAAKRLRAKYGLKSKG